MEPMRFGLSILFLFSVFHTGFAQIEPDPPIVARDYILTRSGSNSLSVSHFGTRRGFEKRFDGVILRIETCPIADFVSLRLKRTGSSEFHSVLLNTVSGQVYDNRLLSLLDFDEKRWSPSGIFTYLNLGSSCGIIRTDQLEQFLSDPREENLSVKVDGIPIGTIFQEEWLSDRFLLLGTGQSGGMAWCLLDIAEGTCHFLDAVGFRGQPLLTSDARSIARLRKLSFERLLHLNSADVQGSEYFTIWKHK